MKDTTYWFYLEPYVYVRIKGNDILLYNTVSGKMLHRRKAPGPTALVMKLKDETNLYGVKVTEKDLEGDGMKEFMDELRTHFMGDIIDTKRVAQKPFLMSPHWDVQAPGDEGTTPKGTFVNVDKNIYREINELSFMITGQCGARCAECDGAHKQFSWCTRTDAAHRLRAADIEEVLKQTTECNIKKINILGGDPTGYEEMDELTAVLKRWGGAVDFYLNILHLEKAPAFADALNEHWRLCLLVNPRHLGERGRPDLLAGLRRKNTRLVFLIGNEDDFAALEPVIEGLPGLDFAVQPYYTGDNLEFFKENVFTDLETLGEEVLSIDTIRVRGQLNGVGYGKLTIAADGDIFSNANSPTLGNIKDTRVAEAVIRELKEQGNWMRVRRHVSPCDGCLLDALCPPLSNVEIASGIHNSCTIWQEN